MEIFEKHPIYNYEVSNLGRVKGKKVDYLKPCISNGYYVVGIHYNGKILSRRIHRLVIETFVGKIDEGLCVNHKDGDKLNNRLDNLEVVTYQENTIHAYENKLARGRKGQENACSKLLLEEIIDIYNMIVKGFTNSEIAGKYNLNEGYISLIRHGKRWTHLWDLYFKEAPISRGNTSLPLDFMLEVIKECESHLTNSEIANKFGLDQSTISRVRNRKTWKSVWKIYELNATTIESTEESGSE